MIYHTHCTDVSTNGGKALRALYCLSFGPKKEYVETDFKPVEYRLGTTLIAFLSTDFASLRAKLLVRTTPMMENQAITEIKNELSTIHPFGERFVQSLFFEEKLADVLDERMEGFEKLQKELSAFADAVLVPDRSKLSAKQRLALYMSRDFQAATAIAGLDLKMRAERKLYVDEQNFDPVLAADRISTPPKSVRFARIEGSDDLGATLLTELLEMVEQGIELKKCEYCHRYFIPFSSKALYCDRSVGDTGKSCKELAVKEKHEKKIAADDGLKLIRQRIKTYDMRVRRTPAIYTDAAFQIWKAQTENARNRYVNGELTYEELDALTQLPKKKGEK